MVGHGQVEQRASSASRVANARALRLISPSAAIVSMPLPWEHPFFNPIYAVRTLFNLLIAQGRYDMWVTVPAATR